MVVSESETGQAWRGRSRSWGDKSSLRARMSTWKGLDLGDQRKMSVQKKKRIFLCEAYLPLWPSGDTI